eukprot:1627763-Pyramimonas_sp.AAC.1
MDDSTVEPPDDDNQEFEDCESEFEDHDVFTIGAGLVDNHEHDGDENKEDDELKGDSHATTEAELVGEEIDAPPRRSRRRRRLRRDPLGMTSFTCNFVLPMWCAMAA